MSTASIGLALMSAATIAIDAMPAAGVRAQEPTVRDSAGVRIVAYPRSARMDALFQLTAAPLATIAPGPFNCQGTFSSCRVIRLPSGTN